MTQTEKLSLNLIAPSDLLDPGVINANMETLDSAVSSAMGDLNAAADAAKADIQELVDTAYKPYVIGTYTGKSDASNVTQTVTLGFKPAFLYVTVHNVSSISSSSLYLYTHTAIPGTETFSGLTITEDGFNAFNGDRTMNLKGFTYYYLALK